MKIELHVRIGKKATCHWLHSCTVHGFCFSFISFFFSRFAYFILFGCCSQTRAILSWILINRIVFIAKPFCAFCHFFPSTWEALLIFDGTWCVLRISSHTRAHTQRQRDECTHFNTHLSSKIISISKHSLSLFLLLFLWLLYCVAFWQIKFL